MRYLVIIGLVLATAACRDTGSSGDDDDSPDAAIDAPPGVGCTTMAPRSVAPETYVAPAGLKQRIHALIDGAQESIDLQIYLFTVTDIADRIIAAKQRGVAVRVLFDPEHAGNSNVRGMFTGAGVSHRNMPTLYAFSHAKFMIIDGQKLVIMSNNFNIDAMSSERNYGMIDRDPDDIADAQAIFDMDWAAGGGEPPMVADLGCTRLIVSPNNSKQRLLELINSAKQTLEVEAMYVSEVTIRNAIGMAKQRGVTVRIILESSGDNADTIAFFRGQGIEVHEASSFYLHAKLIVADGVVFIGSENFSQSALTKNREMGALVFETGPAKAVRDQFDTDWANTPSVP
jgi:phosphatidylserine/phosphatidylglycerophosphate/cardiolipin synthase-like enzyme